LLATYRALIALRRRRPEIQCGDMTLLGEHPEVLAYRRDLAGGPSVIVALNLGDRPQPLPREALGARALFATRADPATRSADHLAPLEGRVLDPGREG